MKKLVVLWLVVIACASNVPQKASVAPRAPRSHDEIQRLSNEIETQRAQMALPEPSPVAPMAVQATPMTNPPSSHDASCTHGTSQTCTDSCTLSDDICLNAKKICDLAHDLPGDDWAAGKCQRGQETCDAAHAKCCACQL